MRGAVNMKTVYETKTFVATASRGNAKWWTGRVLADDFGRFYTQTEAWQTTQSGEESKHLVSTPKLITRAKSQDSEREQAVFEIDALALKQQDKGYRDSDTAPVDKLPLPMLAHDYKKRASAAKFPSYVQPKLDGVRMLWDGTKGWSRLGKLVIPDVIAHLRDFDVQGYILDGELMLPHDKWSFQETVSAVKKAGPLSHELVYHVYDVVLPDMPYTRRKQILERLFAGQKSANVRLVETDSVAQASDIEAAHERYVARGFEGAMLRNPDGLYKVGHRSADLLKFKAMEDAEFEIVDVIAGEGGHNGCAIFVCKTKKGDTFKVNADGSLDERRRIFTNRASYIGKQARVVFQNLSDEGKPRFPTRAVLRDE